ncbi:MAG: hypothetical protein LBK92_02875 [Endomicrobium sp.]|jgi:hypothetical protein|nr:hypothetical protein [Endomicrobium sp.]
MKRSFYLGALVLCLFGNVACADFLDKLLSSNASYKSAVAGKTLRIYEHDTFNGIPLKKNPQYYRAKINRLERDFASKDWSLSIDPDTEKVNAKQKIDDINVKLHVQEVRIQSYAAHRKSLLTAFRYDLPNLNTLISDYVTNFYK